MVSEHVCYSGQSGPPRLSIRTSQFDPERTSTPNCAGSGSREVQMVADEFATNLLPLVQAIQNAGGYPKSGRQRFERSRCPTSPGRQMAPIVRQESTGSY
jgi:hypothetical protein